MLRRQSEVSEEEPVRPLLSLTREPGLIVLFRQLLLSHKTLIDTWLMLLEKGRKPHRAITELIPNTASSPIQQVLSIQNLLLFSNHDRHPQDHLLIL